MLRRAWLVTCLLFLAPTLLAAEKLSSTQIDQLIKEMGARDPKARDAAQKALANAGPEALPALRAAVAHKDLEIRRRATEIVGRVEIMALVAPKLVSLKGERKTAREWLTILAEQTGYKLDVWNDDPKRVQTLDLQNVTFWQAVDEICKFGNIGPQVGYGDDRLRFQKEVGFPAHVVHDGIFRFVPTQFQLHRTLSFRRDGDIGKPPERTETMTLHYTLHVEPKLPLLSVGEALVQEAIDLEGRSLMPLPVPEETDPQKIAQRRARYGNGYATTSASGQLTIGTPANRSAGVKLLRAVVPVTLLVDQKPETVVADVMTVKNKKVTLGTTTFHIEKCELTKEKQYQLKMSVTEDKLEPNDYTWMNTLYRRVELFDEKGNKFQTYGSSWSHNAPNHVQVTFNYGSPGGNPEKAAKLTYQLWKTQPYQVRVELRDLPLP